MARWRFNITAWSREERKNFLSSFFLRGKRRGDRIFKWIVIGAASYSLFMLLLVAGSVAEGSVPIFSLEGIEFLFSTDWNPVPGRDAYGALPYIVGTLVSSGIAIAI